MKYFKLLIFLLAFLLVMVYSVIITKGESHEIHKRISRHIT
jgi:hypothetical protein